MSEEEMPNWKKKMIKKAQIDMLKVALKKVNWLTEEEKENLKFTIKSLKSMTPDEVVAYVEERDKTSDSDQK